MIRDRLVVILSVVLVLLFCAWYNEWDRPIIVWASEVCVHR